MLICDHLWSFLSLCKEFSLVIIYKVHLLLKNSLSFPSFGNVFIFFSFLKDIFTRCRNYSLSLFSFHTWKYCQFLNSRVSYEKFTVIWIILSLQVVFYLFIFVFSIEQFDYAISWYVFQFIILGFYSVYYIECLCLLIKLGTCSNYF